MVGYILAAIDLALANRVGGLVTAPISKISMKLSGYDYPGHTELLAEKTKHPRVRHDAGRRRVPGGPGHHPLRPGRGAPTDNP